MTTKNPIPLFQVGDRVKIRYSDWRGRIVEFRGPLAPGGMFVYRVLFPLKPKPTYAELREDQLVAIPTTPPQVNPSPSIAQAPEAPGQEGDGPSLPEVTKKSAPLFQLGDRVKIRYSDWRGRIVEFRGPLAPGGMFVYRVRVPEKPKPIYIELPEDYLIAIPTPVKAEHSSSARRRVRDERKRE